jgi:hypothetical protein
MVHFAGDDIPADGNILEMIGFGGDLHSKGTAGSAPLATVRVKHSSRE